MVEEVQQELETNKKGLPTKKKDPPTKKEILFSTDVEQINNHQLYEKLLDLDVKYSKEVEYLKQQIHLTQNQNFLSPAVPNFLLPEDELRKFVIELSHPSYKFKRSVDVNKHLLNILSVITRAGINRQDAIINESLLLYILKYHPDQLPVLRKNLKNSKKKENE